MIMTDYEILRDYQAAKHKNSQIKILADLNGCSSEEIRDILRSQGAEMPKKPGPKKAAPAAATQAEAARAVRDAVLAVKRNLDAQEQKQMEEKPAPELDGDYVAIRDALPTMIGQAALSTIGELLKECPDANPIHFREQVRGILRVVAEVEGRCRE